MDLELICLLVSEFWGLRVSVFFLEPLEKLRTGCTRKLRFPPQHRLSGAGISRKEEISVQLVSSNIELTAPLTPGELHWGWLRPTSCLKSIYLGENPLSCFLWLKNTAHPKGGRGHWADSKDADFTLQSSRWKITSPTLFLPLKKNLFSYVVSSVWLKKKRPHSLWLLWTSGW